MESFISLFRDSAGKLKGQLGRLRQDLEQARRRREELLTLPAPTEERAELQCSVIDAKASEYLARFSRNTDWLTRKPLLELGDKLLLQGPAIFLPLQRGVVASLTDVELALAYFFGDQIKGGIRAAFKRESIECGPPRAKRLVELKQLEERIADLESKEAAMRADLAALRNELSD